MGIFEIIENISSEEKKEVIKPIEHVEDVKMEKEEEINTNSEKEWPKEEPKKEENKKPSNEGIYYSKIYYRIYKNIDGEPHEEIYTSQSINQAYDEYDISKTKEAYKKSDGVQKIVYQRGLDGKTTRFIKENNDKNWKP